MAVSIPMAMIKIYRFAYYDPLLKHDRMSLDFATGDAIAERHGTIFAETERSVDESIVGAERDYYVRQLRDWKGSVAIEAMNERGLTVYTQLCAATLAHAHARSGDRIAIASYLGSGDAFDRALLAFSEAYAEQNERDYAALGAAVRAGRVEAAVGV